MQPRELVQAWVEAFNRADVDALAGFYAEDAANHQVAEWPMHGRDAIRRMLAAEFASASMFCIVEHIFEDGEWATSSGGTRWASRGAGSFTSSEERSCSSGVTGTSSRSSARGACPC